MKKQIVAMMDEDVIGELDEFARSHIRSRAWCINYFIIKGLADDNGGEDTENKDSL